MDKQEAIKQAYGERWEFLKENIDENGWFPDSILGDSIWVLSECERTFINNELHWRMSSLKGIEDNNGWIKIESEEDLPKEGDIYYLCGKMFEDGNFVIDEMFTYNSIDKDKFTHYRPIEQPKPPIY